MANHIFILCMCVSALTAEPYNLKIQNFCVLIDFDDIKDNWDGFQGKDHR